MNGNPEPAEDEADELNYCHVCGRRCPGVQCFVCDPERQGPALTYDPDCQRVLWMGDGMFNGGDGR